MTFSPRILSAGYSLKSRALPIPCAVRRYTSQSKLPRRKVMTLTCRTASAASGTTACSPAARASTASPESASSAEERENAELPVGPGQETGQ
jgi:hypothetical protein